MSILRVNPYGTFYELKGYSNNLQVAPMYGRIILIEDDTTTGDIMMILLKRNGYKVEEYVGGEMLMSGNFTLPDLFLFDKQLADLEEMDICRYLKQQPSTSNIPLIIVSATPGLQQIAHDAGADAFIEKPFTSRALLATINSLLQPSNPLH